MSRSVFGVVAVVLAAAVLVAVGRWERGRHVDGENRGLRGVAEQVGSLADSGLDAYRASLVPFDCLLYRRGSNVFALELCIDERGRLVEAFDRRSGFRVWSLREEPGAARVQFDRTEVDRLLRKLGVPPGVDQGMRGQ